MGIKSLSDESAHVVVTIVDQVLKLYNYVIGGRKEVHSTPTDWKEFSAVQKKANTHSDINDHLPTIFLEALYKEPETIVELGTRGGESTYVFEQVAKLCDTDIISVDIQDSSTVTDMENWHFVQSDDISFAGEFERWCDTKNIHSNIDLLFIDTSHEYEHTVQEIKSWFPFLADESVVIFHDTNLTNIYQRQDGSIGRAWNNNRGVIRAIEQYLDCDFDERQRFTTVKGGFIVEHEPKCNGLTILKSINI